MPRAASWRRTARVHRARPDSLALAYDQSGMSFFINVETGRVDIGRSSSRPVKRPRTSLPHSVAPCAGPGDASTAVYSVLRKQVEGESAPRGSAPLYSPRRPPGSLESQGWQEVSVDEIRTGPQALPTADS